MVPAPGKNRAHIDTGGGDRRVQVDRLVALGATEHETRTVPGLTFTVLSDPEGNLFCVADDPRG